MIKIDVWIQFPNAANAQVGEMVCSDPDSRGRRQGAFRYVPDYLSHPHAFSIDPISLPLVDTEFETTTPSGVFPVFVDSLPDDWGLRLLAIKSKLPRGQQSIPNLLLALGAHGMGALSFSQKNTSKNRYNYAPAYMLDQLLSTAEKFEKNEIDNDAELKLLFQAASSPGGARPKALIMDDNIQWIAKFPSVKDTVAVENIEAATLSLARIAGLDVPEFRLVNIGHRAVLMVRRFDVTKAGGRLHMISMQTLLQADGWYNLGYHDLFDLIGKISCQPEIDMPALFRQMVFNAVIGNTDDHLKNFMMIHDDAGYRLSQVYDILPDIENRREHVLMFDLDHYINNSATLERIGKKHGITKAKNIIDQVIAAVAEWRTEFERYTVPPEDAKRLAYSIDKRLNM